MTSWEFPVDDPPVDLQVHLPYGDVVVSAAATATATVTLDGSDEAIAVTRVEFDGNLLSISFPESGITHGSVDVVVELPEGSSCQVNTVSGDFVCTGELGAIDIRTVSGDVSADRVSGQARVGTASGDVSVGQAREANVETASGDVRIGSVSGQDAANVRTSSGDVDIQAASGGRTDVQSASGDISVSVATGVGVYLDLSSVSGTVSSELEPGEETGETGEPGLSLSCGTISGDVRVSRVAPVAAR